jgi:integrase
VFPGQSRLLGGLEPTREGEPAKGTVSSPSRAGRRALRAALSSRDLLGKGVSPKTIGNVIVILKEMFKHAVQWGHLETNPAQYVERPRGEDKEMDVFTPEEIRRLLEAQEESLRTLRLAEALTGMRQGELFGLPWEDVDFVAHLIRVRRALWRGTLPNRHSSEQAPNNAS